MEWTFGGVTYEWSAGWLQGWGAILQAVLTAVAVFAAAWLQNRAQRQQLRNACNARRAACLRCAEIHASIAADLEAWNGDGLYWRPDRTAWKDLRSAKMLTEFYLQQAGVEVPEALALALVTANRITDQTIEICDSGDGWFPATLETKARVIADLRRPAERIREQVQQYDALRTGY